MYQKIPENRLTVVPLFELPVVLKARKQLDKPHPALQPDFVLDDQEWSMPIQDEDAEDLFESLDDAEPAPVFTTDESLDMHRVLLEQSCEQFHEAIQNQDARLLQDIWSWFLDTSWRPFSFRVCAALAEVDTEVFLYQAATQLSKIWPNVLKEKPQCSPTSTCYPMLSQ